MVRAVVCAGHDEGANWAAVRPDAMGGIDGGNIVIAEGAARPEDVAAWGVEGRRDAHSRRPWWNATFWIAVPVHPLRESRRRMSLLDERSQVFGR